MVIGTWSWSQGHVRRSHSWSRGHSYKFMVMVIGTWSWSQGHGQKITVMATRSWSRGEGHGKVRQVSSMRYCDVFSDCRLVPVLFAVFIPCLCAGEEAKPGHRAEQLP